MKEKCTILCNKKRYTQYLSMTKYFKKHKVTIIGSLMILALIVGGYFYYTGKAKNSGAIQYITSQISKGTLTVSISGNGQVLSASTVSIKP